MTTRLEIASRIIAGFASNNAVFAHNPSCGWGLVNAKDDELAAYSIRLADTLIEADAAIAAAPLPPTKAGEAAP